MSENSKTIHLSELEQDRRNANKGTVRGQAMLEASFRKYGAGRSILIDKKGRIIAGNKSAEQAMNIGMEDVIVIQSDGTKLIAVQRTDLDLYEDNTARELAYLDNRTSEVSISWDAEELLADLQSGVDFGDVFNQEELDAMLAGLVAPKKVEDTPPDVSKADELQKKWQTSLGQVWHLGKHRLAVGDCTDAATVARLMEGEKATLCHADPPYGMGKEKDGIANDNLYRDKLDVFQMLWWKTARPHLEDNTSAYIWGNAEDLWRLWYVGGLKDSERLTLRNEIVWDKHHGQGMESDQHRMFPTATERALFFMLGEQGFNNNADNYWEGWDDIVEYLDSQRRLMGWGIKDTKRIAGHSENSGCHWFDKSQWSMPTEAVYKAWQAAAKGDGFKREYDDIKREYDDIKQEFYATRAYFDNTHDNMTDVWQFGRVTGEDRHEHATPKPLEMVARAIKSSTPPDAIVYAPFSGTGPEIIACEQLSRQCRAIELDSGYSAITLERFYLATGIMPVLIS
jgi:DNA modification methylase